MNRHRDLSLWEAWQKMPAARRHVYFFLLLTLMTMVVGRFQEDLDTFKRIMPSAPLPPRITSHEVYPAPVNL